MPFNIRECSRDYTIFPSIDGYEIELHCEFTRDGMLDEHSFQAKKYGNKDIKSSLKSLIEWCVDQSGKRRGVAVNYAHQLIISPSLQPFVAIWFISVSIDEHGKVTTSDIFRVSGPGGKFEEPHPTSLDMAVQVAREKSEEWWFLNNSQPMAAELRDEERDNIETPDTQPSGWSPFKKK